AWLESPQSVPPYKVVGQHRISQTVLHSEGHDFQATHRERPEPPAEHSPQQLWNSRLRRTAPVAAVVRSGRPLGLEFEIGVQPEQPVLPTALFLGGFRKGAT